MSMPEPQKTLAIILVLYHAYDDTEAFLAAQKPADEGLLYVVVDNTPHERIDHDALARIAKHSGARVLVAEPENLGYAGAAHFALQQMPELADFDYVALSNTDLIYDAADIREKLSKNSADHGGVGAIAPRLTMPDGSAKAQLHYVKKPSRARYARLARIFASYPLTIAHRLGADLKRGLGFSRDKGEIPRDIFAPHGALMIVTRDYLSKTAGFDHPAFLFCEEIFIGSECEKAGLNCIYDPGLTYSHENHGAMGAIPSRRVVQYLHDAHRAVLPMLD